MSFESPDVEKEFPGLYASQGLDPDLSEEEERSTKKRDSKSREKKRDRKDKGYRMFEEEDSEEELVIDDTRSPSKMKKHSKPSFKFPKKEKFYKAKEKEKDLQKEREKEEKKREDKESKKEKLKFKKKKPSDSKPDASTEETKKDVKPIFGVPLAAAVERSRCHDGVQLPAIFRECIDYVEEFGLSCEGIYRISGVKSKVQHLKDCYNRGQPLYLHEHEPPIIASLLKQYLRELPEPVLTLELMPKFEQASILKNVKQKVEQFQQLIEQLPVANRLLLSWMIVHMTHVIAKESQNKMSLQNVSIVLSPTMQISHRVLNVFFTYSKILFRDTVIKRYVPPLRPVSSRWSLELPESPSAIEEELHKQESLLNQLHEDVRKVKNAADKEEQLWEVQRVVTQLKRKLKHVRKAQDAAKAAERREAELAQMKLKEKEEDEKKKQELLRKEREERERLQKQAATETETTEVDTIETEEQPTEPTAAGAAAKEIEENTQARVSPVELDRPEEDKEKEEEDAKDQEPQQQQEDQQQQRAEVHEPELTQAQAEPDDLTTDHKENQEISPPVQNNESTSQPEETEEGPQEQPIQREEPSVPQPPTVQRPSPTEETPTTGETEVVVVQTHPPPANHSLAPQQQHAGIPKLQSPLQPQRLHEIQQSHEGTAEQNPTADNGVLFEVGGEEFHSVAKDKEGASSGEDEVTDGMERLEVEDRQITTIEIVDREGLPSVETTDAPVKDDDVSDVASSSSSLISSPDEEDGSDSEELHSLILEETTLTLHEEELRSIGDELRQKIETERSEIERLHQEIAELQEIRDDLYEEDDSEDDSSSSSEDEDELQDNLQKLIRENQELQVQNADLCEKVHQERQICLDVKVQIRLIQLGQAEAARQAGGQADAERELMIF